jgi:hypothetical protein
MLPSSGGHPGQCKYNISKLSICKFFNDYFTVYIVSWFLYGNIFVTINKSSRL